MLRLIKKKLERTQINKFRNKREVTTENTKIQIIIRNCYEQLYVKKLDNVSETEKFLEIYNVPKLNQEEAESLSKPVTSSEIKAVIKKKKNKKKPHLTYKSPGLDGFTGIFYQTFKEELTPILLKLFQKFKKRENSQTL